VLAFIASADQTLDVCVFDLDLPEFAQALLDAHARGVKVRVIIADDNAAKAYAVADQLKQMEEKGILTLAHNRSGLMHNKFMIADGLRVWTGSYNLTRNCSRFNDNHAIVLESPELAENYEKEWQEIFEKRHGKRFGYPTPHPEVNVGGAVVHNLFTPRTTCAARS
jgi:phosphatidylserine/phosphatidylglycerophosphate/cardiolipin synthase-like enzyme